MTNLVSLIIVCCVIYVIIKKSKESLESAGKNASKGQSVAGGRRRPQGFTNYRPHKDIISVSREMGDSKGSVLRDDRRNDWLARQLREEHMAFKATSEMFDLKIEHASHCDARLMEQFHKRNCTASGIDMANGSTIKRK